MLSLAQAELARIEEGVMMRWFWCTLRT